MSDHPDLRQLAAFLDGRLPDRNREAIEQHIAECASCCERMSKIPQDTLSARLQDVDTGVTDSFVIGTDRTSPADGDKGIPAELVEHPRYRILEPLGRGGMGVVYKAQHRMMDRLVALKVIDGRLIENPKAIVRFRNEVKAAARLSHANIVRAYDAEQEGNLHFLVMEYVDGINLAEFVRRRSRLQIDQACGVVRKVAQALQHAFQMGMVHRDIKPQNIMVTQDGRVCVLDFGLARLIHERETDVTENHNPGELMQRTASALTIVGSVLGTPDYIAPEQVADAHLADTRADIYSLGCTFYFLLTGKPPFPEGTVLQKLMAHRDGSPAPVKSLRPDVPEPVAAIVQRMMARKPEDRFQTPAEVVAAIEAVARQRKQAKAATTSSETIERTSQEQTPSAGAGETVKSEANAKQHPTPEVFLSPPPIQVDTRPSLRTRSRKSQRPLPRWLFPAGTLLAVTAVIIGLTMSGGNDENGSGQQSESAPPEQTDNQNSAADRYPRGDGEWLDLLAGIDLSAQSEGGDWTRTGSTITASSAPYAKLRLQSDVPREYDLEVTFTRVAGGHSVALIFVAGGHQATFELDAWEQHLAGIQQIDGQDLQQTENPTRVSELGLVNSRQYAVSLRVRRDRVEVWMDGQQVTTYFGDGTNLSPLPDWALSDATAIGVGAYLSETVFHQIRLRPVNGSVE
ncbi:MAG: protein kinase [Planctomycetaceae bacterium]|nr:protein kinase [Planctomycetaceae bacterium]